MIQKIIKKQWFKIAIGLLLPSISALCAQNISAKMGENIVAQMAIESDLASLFFIIASGFLGYFLAQVFWGVGKSLMNYTSTSLECKIKNTIFNKILRAEYNIFLEKKPEELFIHYNRDIQYVLSMFTTDLYNIIYAVVMGSGIYLLVMVRNFVVSIAVAVVVVAVIIINAFYVGRYKDIEYKERKIKEENIGVISQIINAKAIIQILNLQGVTNEEYEKINKNYYAIKQKHNQLNLNKALRLDWLVYFCATMILPISCLMVSMGKIDLADVIYIMQLTGNVIWSTSNLGTAWIDFNRKKIALNSLNQLLQFPEEENEKDAVRVETFGDMALTFENVTIWYKDFAAVSNLNFVCKKGSITVIMGRSGIGKSSIFNAVLGFADYSGVIKVWQEVVTKKNIKAIRSSIAYMSEFCEMNNVTLKEAIEFSIGEMNNEDFCAHTKRLGIDKVQNVEVASGGEKQRISFLRAYMKKCDIYFFDEPTAALDEQNESVVINYINELKKYGKTVVVITHQHKFEEVADQVIELG